MASLDDITLPDDFIWSDEFSWSPVAATAPARTLGGAAVVHQGTKYKGRPITLTSTENWFWIDHATLELLKAKEATAGLEMQLTIRDDDPRTVIFRHWDGGVEATPIIDYEDRQAADLYMVTLRLMEV